MPSLLDIKARIKLVSNIKKITKAMQLVAAAKFTRAQNRARATRPYREELDSIMSLLASILDPGETGQKDEKPVELAFLEDGPAIRMNRSLLFERAEEERPGIVLITADRGLCGAFNTRLIREAQEFLRGNGNKDCKLITLGKKGYQYFKNKKIPILFHRSGISDRLILQEVKEVTARLVELFARGEVDALHLIYTRFKSAMISSVTKEKFLGIPRSVERGREEIYILEPDKDKLFARIFPAYATTKIFSALAESFASEYGARMSAMQLATKNAEEMLDDLVILRNRLRQAAITKELAEIVGGAEALK